MSGNVKDMLQGLLLFSDLSSMEIDKLASHFRLIDAQKGERLIREGEMVRSIFFVVSGDATVLKEDANGKLVEIATVGKRAVLGEMSLLEFVQASATIEAKGPFQALVIERATLNRVMDSNPQLGYKILKKVVRVMSQRLKTTSDQLTEFMAIPPDLR